MSGDNWPYKGPKEVLITCIFDQKPLFQFRQSRCCLLDTERQLYGGQQVSHCTNTHTSMNDSHKGGSERVWAQGDTLKLSSHFLSPPAWETALGDGWGQPKRSERVQEQRRWRPRPSGFWPFQPSLRSSDEDSRAPPLRHHVIHGVNPDEWNSSWYRWYCTASYGCHWQWVIKGFLAPLPSSAPPFSSFLPSFLSISWVKYWPGSSFVSPTFHFIQWQSGGQGSGFWRGGLTDWLKSLDESLLVTFLVLRNLQVH